MVRHLALVALAISAPLSAASPPRSFTVTSFDRIRVEGPYAVALTVGASPAARAEGPAAALDSVDLRVEGRTLIIRQRSGARPASGGEPVRIRAATPDLRSASLLGAGSLAIDRLRGLSVEVSVGGSGSLAVGDIQADRLHAFVGGSGALSLRGRAKSAVLRAQGTPVIDAAQLRASQVTIAAEGAAEVAVEAEERANVTATGTALVRLGGTPACELKAAGSASVEGCEAR